MPQGLIEAFPVSAVMYLPMMRRTYAGDILRAIEAACRKGVNVMRLRIWKAIVPNEELVLRGPLKDIGEMLTPADDDLCEWGADDDG
jgi:hypothetical protein